MAFEHKYFGKSISNKFIISLDHFFRKMTTNNFDPSSNTHRCDDLMFANNLNLSTVIPTNDNKLNEVSGYQSHRVEVSKFLRSGLR